VENIFKRKKVVIWEGGVKGQCFGALREDASEGLNVTADAIIWFPELGTES